MKIDPVVLQDMSELISRLLESHAKLRLENDTLRALAIIQNGIDQQTSDGTALGSAQSLPHIESEFQPSELRHKHNHQTNTASEHR